MLPKEVLEEPNAVEKYFIPAFEKTPRYVVKEEIFPDTYLALSQLIIIAGMERDHENSSNTLKHISFYNLTVSIFTSENISANLTNPFLITWFGLLADRPAIIRMYAAYLQYWASKNNISKPITLDILLNKIFPNGFPKNEELIDAWKAQKVERPESIDSDNLLDYLLPYKSIQLKKEAED